MQEKHTQHHETNAVSRRSFVRYTAAAAAAAAICRNARANIPVDDLGVDTRCKEAIRLLLPCGNHGTGMPVARLMRAPLRTNMDWFICNAGNSKVKEIEDLLTQLRVRLDELIEDGDPRGNWTLRDFYANDTTDWDGTTYSIFIVLAIYIQCPFLVLLDRSTERRDAADYLDDPQFLSKLGIKATCDFWLNDRNDHLQYHIEPSKWIKAREGWQIGVWVEKRPHVMLEADFHIFEGEDGTCWDGESCVDGDPENYCERDPDNGQPTTATDPC